MITIGITELHGIAREIMQNPPAAVNYIEIRKSNSLLNQVFTSSAKGVLNYFDGSNVDLIEAPLFPILTSKKWIYTPADFQTCANFGILNLPLPRWLRVKYLEYIFLKDNFKKLLFKSEAGKRTLNEYAKVTNEKILNKVQVVYPAVRKIDDQYINFNKEKINITFVGEFLRKGGVHVVDVFELLQNKYKNIHLYVCSNENFQTTNIELTMKYLKKLKDNKKITFGFVDRDVLLNEIYPKTDIFVCPTYQETYGYAIEEAMAYGIPIISTNYFAIPEIIDHEETGFLIQTQQFDFINNFKGYIVHKIPDKFYHYMNRKLYQYLTILIEDSELRYKMGKAALTVARSKFSFEKRNSIMLKVYENAFCS